MTRALGCDASFWNGVVDFVKMKAAGVAFCYAKVSQLSADSRFSEYWPAMKAAGLLRGAYHYLDYRTSEMTQAKLFTDMMGGDWGELPPVCDFEMLNAPSDAHGHLWNFLQEVERITKRIPMIYSGYYYFLQSGTPDKNWLKYPFWLAWYANESIIKVPPPWTKWTFWQYTGNGPGPQYGSTGLSLDMDWYNGTLEELQAFANMPVTPPIPAPVPQPAPQPTYPAYKTSCLVNVRKDAYKPVPPERDNIIGIMPKDELVYIDTYHYGGYSHFQPTILFPNGGWIASSLLILVHP